ncbi:MAG: hypothetical protein HYR81_02245 [Nitrospirae bacterium]|nr:hypothetical protein [Nitrospirota bacterium]
MLFDKVATFLYNVATTNGGGVL